MGYREEGMSLKRSDEIPSIAFFYAKPYDQEFFDEANQNYGFSIRYLKAHLNQETAYLSKGHQVVCVSVNDCVDQKILELLLGENVKLLALRSSGYNHVDLKGAYKHIPVVRVPDYSPYSIAEHTVGLMLCLNRKMHKAHQRVLSNNFSIEGLLGFDMHGKTVGIIGLGKIGKAVAQILKGMGMRILVYDINPDQDFSRKLGIELVELNDLYQESHVITLHCPLTSESQHLINRKAFDKMQKGVMIINTGRGGLIHTTDLLYSLKNGKVGAAGLDVYENERSYFHENLSNTFVSDDILARLMTFPNVLITSHQAFFTRESLKNIAATTLKNIQEFCTNKPLKNEVKWSSKDPSP